MHGLKTAHFSEIRRHRVLTIAFFLVVFNILGYFVH